MRVQAARAIETHAGARRAPSSACREGSARRRSKFAPARRALGGERGGGDPRASDGAPITPAEEASPYPAGTIATSCSFASSIERRMPGLPAGES